jgi:hypothetical protein
MDWQHPVDSALKKLKHGSGDIAGKVNTAFAWRSKGRHSEKLMDIHYHLE